MTLFRGTVLDTPDDPFAGGAPARRADCAAARRGTASSSPAGRSPRCAPRIRTRRWSTCAAACSCPGFVDTHVHFPQVRVIGGLGMPLLDWLDRCALPEEARLADVDYARGVAARVRRRAASAPARRPRWCSARTSPPRWTCCSTRGRRAGLRVTAGLVRQRPDAAAGAADHPGAGLRRGPRAGRRAGTARAGSGTPSRRGSRCRPATRCWSRARPCCRDVDGALVHLARQREPRRDRDGRAACSRTARLHRHLRPARAGRPAQRVRAQRPPDRRRAGPAGRARAPSVAHCPTSNCALGSGLFPLRRHVEHGVRVALGSDVGAGTGFSLLKEGLQAYFMQQLLGADGLPLTSAHLLYLATRAGADALGLGDEVGDLSVGQAVRRRLAAAGPRQHARRRLGHAADADDALAKVFALGEPSDVRGVWVGGDRLR